MPHKAFSVYVFLLKIFDNLSLNIKASYFSFTRTSDSSLRSTKKTPCLRFSFANPSPFLKHSYGNTPLTVKFPSNLNSLEEEIQTPGILSSQENFYSFVNIHYILISDLINLFEGLSYFFSLHSSGCSVGILQYSHWWEVEPKASYHLS